MKSKRDKSLFESLVDSKGKKSWQEVKEERRKIDPQYAKEVENEAQDRLHNLGDVIKAIRLETRFNQRTLAARAMINQSVLSRLESNLTDPNIGTISRILESMGWHLGAINENGTFIQLTLVSDDDLLYRGIDPTPKKNASHMIDAMFGLFKQGVQYHA